MLSLAQLKVRQTGITATDIVTIAGENPWSSPALVYESKFLSDAELTERMNAFPKDRERNGQVFEAALARRYVMDMPEPLTVVESAATYRASDCEWALATPDRFVFRGGDHAARAKSGDVSDWLLECKLVGSRVADAWQLDAEADAEAVPPYVYTQVQWQMRVLGYDRCDVATLLIGTTFKRFRILYDEPYVDALQQVADEFWQNNVLARRPPEPDGTDQYNEFLARRFSNRVDAKIEAPEGAEALVRRWQGLRATEKQASKEKKKVLQTLSMMAGSSAGFDGPFGKVTTFSKKGRVDVNALAKGEGISPEVLDRYRGPAEQAVRVTAAKTDEEMF
jgi:putative phage-type endonuclease